MFRFTKIFILLMVCGCNSQTPSKSVLTATVVSYGHNVEWDHFDDGSFATFDQLTLKLNSDKSLFVTVFPDVLPNDSPFRVPGTRFTFTLDEPIDSDTQLTWSAINNPAIIK